QHFRPPVHVRSSEVESGRTAPPKGGARSTTEASKEASSARGEHALKGDVEVERQVRLQVVVRLVATGGSDGLGGKVHQVCCNLILIERRADRARDGLSRAGIGILARLIRRHESMRVRRNFALEQTHRLTAAGLAKIVQRKPGALPGMHRGAS